MKRLTKFSLTALGLGFTFLALYKLKQGYDTLAENHFIHAMLSKYYGYPVKGTWVQHSGSNYIGGITVKVNGHWHYHHFRTDPKRHVILDD